MNRQPPEAGRRRRAGIALLTVLLLWQRLSSPWCVRCCAAAYLFASRTPLVLIAEPERSGGQIPKDFTGACESQGYVAGESLFSVSLELFSDLGQGAGQAAELVNACTSRVPSGQVDVIACGVAGLAARLALEAGMIPDRAVRNLVMVASPNRGSFLVCVLKSIVEIAKHESLFEKDSRGWRYLPTGEDILSLFSSGSDSGETGDGRLSSPKDMEWSDETSWVAQRALEVYEPLYARYVEARYNLLPYVPAQSPKETFAGWICRTMPQFWQSAVMRSGQPPGGSPTYAAGGTSIARTPPPAGKDLSAAYYELLAMEVAKNQYVMRLASKGNVVESLLKEPYVPSGWKDALIHYGVRVLQHYARKALLTVKAELQKVMADHVVRRTGFIEDSASPMLRHLIKDDVIVNLGTSVSTRFERVPANTYLSALNAASLEHSSARHTRYVSIAAKLASPWNLIWPQLGPNDYLLEIDSTVAPPGPRDCHRVFGGLFSPSGEGLLGSKEVRSYLFALLGEGTAGSLPVYAGATGGKMRVSSWAPSYADSGGSQALAVTLSDPPAGWQFQAWTEGDSSPECRSLRFIPIGGTYTLDASLGRVGLRLTRSGPVSPIQGRSVASAYATEAQAEAVVRMPVLGTVAEEAPKEGAGEPTFPPVPVEGDDPALARYPLVRVINRSKRTSHEEPVETHHGSWVIDFGDGDVLRIEGNPEMTFSHAFPKEGSYRVHAQSYDNRGDLLLERSWSVAVTGDSLKKEFSCRSIPRLRVEVDLSGPAMWVTGKPAVFSAETRIDAGPGVEVVSIEYDPGPKFCVLWERSGDFQVSCAATVRLRYFLEDETLTVKNTYVAETTVSVLTTGVTR